MPDGRTRFAERRLVPFALHAPGGDDLDAWAEAWRALLDADALFAAEAMQGLVDLKRGDDADLLPVLLSGLLATGEDRHGVRGPRLVTQWRKRDQSNIWIAYSAVDARGPLSAAQPGTLAPPVELARPIIVRGSSPHLETRAQARELELCRSPATASEAPAPCVAAAERKMASAPTMRRPAPKLAAAALAAVLVFAVLVVARPSPSSDTFRLAALTSQGRRDGASIALRLPAAAAAWHAPLFISTRAAAVWQPATASPPRTILSLEGGIQRREATDTATRAASMVLTAPPTRQPPPTIDTAAKLADSRPPSSFPARAQKAKLGNHPESRKAARKQTVKIASTTGIAMSPSLLLPDTLKPH